MFHTPLENNMLQEIRRGKKRMAVQVQNSNPSASCNEHGQSYDYTNSEDKQSHTNINGQSRDFRKTGKDYPLNKRRVITTFQVNSFLVIPENDAREIRKTNMRSLLVMSIVAYSTQINTWNTKLLTH